jgi:hypothetical protein
MSQAITPAGQSIEAWAKQVNLCRATVYQLEPQCQPHSITVGRRRIIIEPPADWLARMASIGGARVKRKQAEAA